MTRDLAAMLLVPERFYSLFDILSIALLIFILLLKGLALWRSARLGQTVWFWVLLFVNTLGILEIVYLLTHKDGYKEVKKKEKKEKKEQPKPEVEEVVVPPMPKIEG